MPGEQHERGRARGQVRREVGGSGGGGRFGFGFFHDGVIEGYVDKAVQAALTNLESRPAKAGEVVVTVIKGEGVETKSKPAEAAKPAAAAAPAAASVGLDQEALVQAITERVMAELAKK